MVLIKWDESGVVLVAVRFVGLYKVLQMEVFDRISKMTVSSTPIYALVPKPKGWRDLSVYTRGLGQVVLKYNGKSYPSNPSLASKYTANLRQAGNTLWGVLPICSGISKLE